MHAVSFVVCFCMISPLFVLRHCLSPYLASFLLRGPSSALPDSSACPSDWPYDDFVLKLIAF